MLYDLILKNGLVVDPYNNIHAKMDVGIKDGVIATISEDLTEGQQTIDVTGKAIFPGVVDMHVHVGRRFNLGSYQMIAETGVTTAIDLAGPIDEILEDIPAWGSGLNLGTIEAIIPGQNNLLTKNPTEREVKKFLEESLEKGALGLKLFGGHAPLTPEATKAGIDIANDLGVIVAFHAGTTATKSDLTGMREAVELAKGNRLLLAHINAYLRGNVNHPLEELQEGLQLLKDHDNIFSDSHLAVMNAAKGSCENGEPTDYVTKVCLNLYGFPVSEKGISQAIEQGIVQVMKRDGLGVKLVSHDEALQYWQDHQTNVSISFPVNLPTVATACLVERKSPGGDFLVDMASTDGGGIPRNNLVKRTLSYYQLGYLSLDDVVRKISLNPAQIFGLEHKGHLSIGTDADLTIVDLKSSEATMSIIDGKINMFNGVVLRKGGKLLITEAGRKKVQQNNLNYEIVNLENSLFYD